MKFKIAAISLALTTASILGACADNDGAVRSEDEDIIEENTLIAPEPTKELGESTEIKSDDPVNSEDPSVTDELPGATIDGDGNLELTTPEIETEGDLTTEETVTPESESVDDTGEISTEETQPLPEADTQTSN